jgi:hypothetical protein
MNNNITEDYCSPKVSSLLEEKGMARGAWLVPTQALAIKWIRENFGIHISFLLRHEDKISYDFYIEKIEITNEYKTIGPEEFFYYESPEEAADAALLYILKHLI